MYLSSTRIGKRKTKSRVIPAAPAEVQLDEKANDAPNMSEQPATTKHVTSGMSCKQIRKEKRQARAACVQCKTLKVDANLEHDICKMRSEHEAVLRWIQGVVVSEAS